MGANTAMAPGDFTMWLRGVLDSVGEGKPIPADVAQTLYSKLSEVVAGQVANRLLKEDTTEADLQVKQYRLALEQQRMQMEMELKREEMERRWPQHVAPTVAPTVTYGAVDNTARLGVVR